jgi:hypothetical protein
VGSVGDSARLGTERPAAAVGSFEMQTRLTDAEREHAALLKDIG